jgi:hypothetical protein
MYELNNIKFTIETPTGEVKLAPMAFRLVALLQSLRDAEGNHLIISHAEARAKVGSGNRQYFDSIVKSLIQKGIPIKSFSEGLIWGEGLKMFQESEVESEKN